MQSVDVNGSRVIRLAGRVTAPTCAELRELTFARLPVGITSIVIEAGDVTAIDDAVFSVLLAASAWHRSHGATLAFGGTSASVRRSIAALELGARLPLQRRSQESSINA